MLENLIAERLKQAEERLTQAKQTPHDIYSGRPPTAEIKEYHFWRDLELQAYWHPIENTERLNALNPEEKKTLAQIIYEQILKGERRAARHPEYAAVWNELLPSPLGEFISTEQITHAVNHGFWDTLSRVTQADRFSHTQSQELVAIMVYQDFFKHFDFVKGIDCAQKADIKPDPNSFPVWPYLTWYIVQKEYIERTHRSDSAEICGKLIAPVVHEIIASTRQYNIEPVARNLLAAITPHNILVSSAVQQAVSIIFEEDLRRLFEGGDYLYDSLEIAEKALADKNAPALRAWTSAKNPNLTRIEASVRKYVPAEAYTAEVEKVKARMYELTKIDKEIVSLWVNLREQMNDRVYTAATAHVAQVYRAQKTRPSKDELFLLRRTITPTDQNTAHIFADFLFRNQFSEANNILHDYKLKTRAPNRNFVEGLFEYVSKFGKIRAQPDAFHPRICFPKYNLIADLKQTKPDLFRE